MNPLPTVSAMIMPASTSPQPRSPLGESVSRSRSRPKIAAATGSSEKMSAVCVGVVNFCATFWTVKAKEVAGMDVMMMPNHADGDRGVPGSSPPRKAPALARETKASWVTTTGIGSIVRAK